MREHLFVVTDRGTNHIHRYTPSCLCGWVGVHRPSVGRAKAEWRIHENGSIQRTKRMRRGLGSHGHRLTPVDELPEALR